MIPSSIASRIAFFDFPTAPGGNKCFHDDLAGDRWLPVTDMIFCFHFCTSLFHHFKNCRDSVLPFACSLMWYQPLHNFIRASKSSPASKSKRLMAESVIFSLVRLIGLRCISTNLCNKFHFSHCWGNFNWQNFGHHSATNNYIAHEMSAMSFFKFLCCRFGNVVQDCCPAKPKIISSQWNIIEHLW